MGGIILHTSLNDKRGVEATTLEFSHQDEAKRNEFSQTCVSYPVPSVAAWKSIQSVRSDNVQLCINESLKATI